MSQLVACRSASGVVFGTDSKAIHYMPSGDHGEMEIERLVRLSDRAVIVAGGAAETVGMCQSLQRFVKEENLEGVDEIYRAALPFLSSEYERFMRKTCEMIPLDPIRHVYFVLGGQTSGDGKDPFRLYLIWPRKKLPQLDGEEISTAYTVPRRMSLELALDELGKSNAAPGEALKAIREGMDRLARLEEVERPFRFASVDGSGVTLYH
ncbi:MAG: hypothetical protein AB9873_11875 [Syntrophobacteraceae bacterium]